MRGRVVHPEGFGCGVLFARGSSDADESYEGKAGGATPRKHRRGPAWSTKKLTIHDLGWTRERAWEVRAKLGTFAVDWDDPSMDVYDEA